MRTIFVSVREGETRKVLAEDKRGKWGLHRAKGKRMHEGLGVPALGQTFCFGFTKNNNKRNLCMNFFFTWEYKAQSFHVKGFRFLLKLFLLFFLSLLGVHFL